MLISNVKKPMHPLLLTSVLILISPLSALRCGFHIDSIKNYICELSNATPNEYNFIHTLDGYDNTNVTIITSIIDENSTLPILDGILMRKFINLRKLEILFFHVEEVAVDAFENCENIEEISLNYNKLTDLPGGVFRKCINLKVLKLASNLFTRIPAEGFFELASLETLKMDNNPLIEVFNDDFRYLTGLKEIFLSDTGIKSFDVSNFEVVDLRSNNFDRFDVLNALKLKSLNLSKNSLKSIKFFGSSNLTELDLSMNSLVNIPLSTFGSLNNLKILKLSWNPKIIKNIFRGFFEGLTNLEILELKSCEITEISGSSFHTQHSLQELDLSHNSIQELPYVFSVSNLAYLRVLKISSNLLTEVKSTTFKNLTSLTAIDLSHNFISKVHENSFYWLDNLKKLNLASNRIKFLDLSMFPLFSSKFTELDVSYNFINAIEPGFGVKFYKNLHIIGTDNPCSYENSSLNLEMCFENYEDQIKQRLSTTTTTEATTEDNAQELDFSLKDLLFTIVCILFIAILLIAIAFYINGILNLFGIYEKPVVKDNNESSVTYQKF